MRYRFDPYAQGIIVTWVFGALVLAFIAAPLLIVIPAAFNDSTLLRFPPQHWSLRWFREYFTNPSWIDATITSVQLATVVSAASTLIGLATAVVLDRFSFIGRNLLRALVMAPLLVPVVVIGVALYYMFLRIGLNGSFWALAIGHTVITFPYATVVIGASLVEVDRRLEQAAVGLGAIRPRAFLEVTLPLIRPGIAVAALFGFLVSFDEVVIAIFLAGPSTTTLPRRIWDGIRFDLNPTIAAVASLLIALSTFVMLLSELLRRYLVRRSGLSTGGAS
jgi:putative spermidine/putrescine transport system permease protein